MSNDCQSLSGHSCCVGMATENIQFDLKANILSLSGLFLLGLVSVLVHLHAAAFWYAR